MSRSSYACSMRNMSGKAEDSVEMKLQRDQILETAEQFQTCSDEMQGEDPGCVAYDMTADPVRWAEASLLKFAGSLKHLLDDSVLPGEPYRQYGDAVVRVLDRIVQTAQKINPYIGGVNISIAHRGLDGSAKSVRHPIPFEYQRKALDLLLKIMRPQRAGLLPPADVLDKLVKSQSGDAGVQILNLKSEVTALQESIISALFEHMESLVELQDSTEAASTRGERGLTCGELLNELTFSVFGFDYSNSSSLMVAAPQDWDLQVSLAAELRNAHMSEVSHQEVVALASHHMQLARDAAGRSLTAVRTGSGQHDAGLEEHLLLLRQKLQPKFYKDELLQSKSAAAHRGHLAALAAALLSMLSTIFAVLG
eukprot:gnl/TRDRNA2_/TRDRNA2_173210_c1_seq1.p1 gnl/TRDRNA2_/TRDRNA2_173210_c1~~gnl/TRDRNA2_/TRDRNA2_173210_c1_seq1.p1  ORF type:complete len:366 (+),score=67.73 gnl/TRDRNA2_/TRDRNA2_173210_c1_seq1:62-1159(+)